MAMNIKHKKAEKLADEISRLTGESKTAAVLRALEERRERLALGLSGTQRMAQALDYLEKEIWPNIPRKLLGRRLSKKERERILGYGDATGVLLRFFEETGIQIVSFTTLHWQRAVEAYARFGKGRHPAGLNFGDCMTYATALSLASRFSAAAMTSAKPILSLFSAVISR